MKALRKLARGNEIFGTLPDHEIERLANLGELITENFSRNGLRQACYEVRASSICYYPLVSDERHSIDDGSYILIKPRQTVVIITMESLALPGDMLARIMTKGQLFSIGLLPVSTYADPGFVGKLGIVFFNSSTNYLKIRPGDSICKLEFSRMQESVERPYSGQHGYETSIWPVPRDYILSEDDIKRDKRIASASDELLQSYGREVAGTIHTVDKYYKRLVLVLIAYMIASLLFIAYLGTQQGTTLMAGIALGLVANVLTGLLMWDATTIKRLLKK